MVPGPIKCDNCAKNITKSKPGVECNTCEKLVHLSAACTGLTNKQVTALRANESLEWTCLECQHQSSKRRSIIIPDDEEDGEENAYHPSDNAQININRILKDLTKQVEKTIKTEMKDINHSLQMRSELVEDALGKIKSMQGVIADLQKKNIDLSNKNRNLETRVGALEQRMQGLEQQKLSKHIEVYNIPVVKDENPHHIAQVIAEKINQSTEDVKEAQSMPGKKECPGPIQIVLTNEKVQEKWVETFKQQQREKVNIKVSSVIPEAISPAADGNVVIREALTPYNKYLLWYAKEELKQIYKFIWVKKGILRVCKEDKDEKPIIVRSVEDIKQLKTCRKLF